MWKISQFGCNKITGKIVLGLNSLVIAPATTFLADTGAQAINMSFGTPEVEINYCELHPERAWCLAITHATSRGVALVAASGNNRGRLHFPARDARVIAVGGFDSNLALWDESPGSFTNCPPKSEVGVLGRECGSNYTTVPSEPKQELMGSSKAALSTTYPNYNWNNIGCGDGFGGAFGDGQGWCTGTSMSAPQVAGVVGLLRSINPLLLPSKPVLGFGDVAGIRTVLAQTTAEAQNNQAWNAAFGYGHPDAAAAARKLLGRVAGAVVRNRVTPLFRMYSAGGQDTADTTSPQIAVALNIYQAASYAPQGQMIPGYASFPSNPTEPTLPTPRAKVYVLTTEYTPQAKYPPLVPLYLMDRSRNWPAGCTAGAPGCNHLNRDFTLITTTADIEQAHADGFGLSTIQGYIYQLCTPEPQCIPPGAQKFYRQCNIANDDCATFLESERLTFEAQGYTTAYPAVSSKLLGYAYPPTDSDGDGLIDGFEYVIGTHPYLADSDGNGSSDGAAIPMASVPVTDPCVGQGAVNCPGDSIFKDGFNPAP